MIINKQLNMQKKFVIQNAIDKTYWYGWYTNKKWTDDILEAYFFMNEQELEDWIKSNFNEIEGMALISIEIWV